MVYSDSILVLAREPTGAVLDWHSVRPIRWYGTGLIRRNYACRQVAGWRSFHAMRTVTLTGFQRSLANSGAPSLSAKGAASNIYCQEVTIAGRVGSIVKNVWAETIRAASTAGCPDTG